MAIFNASAPGGLSTDDATATAADILTGKTAYARGVKLVGTYKPFYGGPPHKVNIDYPYGGSQDYFAHSVGSENWECRVDGVQVYNKAYYIPSRGLIIIASERGRLCWANPTGTTYSIAHEAPPVIGYEIS